MALAAAELLTPLGLESPQVRSRLWQKRIAAQPKGFYASLTDPTELADQSFGALTMNDAEQLRYLTEVFREFVNEYGELPRDQPADWMAHPRFFLRNDAFQSIDALAYWGLIRSIKPARIVELGSGYSTLLAAEALQRNGSGELTAIDPHPREFVRRCDLPISLITEQAEFTPASRLLDLRRNDIAFVDSSHVVRQGGDVTWFFLHILPKLADGVLVHVHDIHFPFDYPHELVTRRNTYWTEQYLLYAYLLKNSTDTTLFASRYVAHRYPELARLAFSAVDRPDGSSFWFRVGRGVNGTAPALRES